MTAQDVSFHVRHEVFPDRILAIMRGISEGETIEEITQWDRQLKRMRDLELVTEDRSLTSIAQLIIQITTRKEFYGETWLTSYITPYGM